MTLESRCGDFNAHETDLNENRSDFGEIIVVVNDNEDYTQQNNEEIINISSKDDGKGIKDVKSGVKNDVKEKSEINIPDDDRGSASGEPENVRTTALDLAFSCFVVGPLAVLYWRGTFNFISTRAFKGQETETKIIRAVLLYNSGLFLKILLDIIKAVIYPSVHLLGTKVLFILKFLLLYCDSLSGVILWVGGFNLLYLGPQLYWFSLTSVLIFASLCMMWLDAFHGTGGSPLIVVRDNIKDVLNVTGYFETNFFEGRKKFIADIIITYTVIHPLMICVWWGVWELENNYILQEMEIIEKDVQAWDSIFIVIIMVISVMMLERHFEKMRDSCNEKLQWPKLKYNFAAFLALLSAVNYWRGVWSLLDFYFLPNIPPQENFILSHLIGFHLLYLLGAASNLTMASSRDALVPTFSDYKYFNKKEVNYSEDEGREEERRNLI